MMWQGRPSSEEVKLNSEIKGLGAKGDVQGLLEVVRRQKKQAKDGPAPLGFTAVTCSNWLNK